MEFMEENMVLFRCYQELLQPHRINKIVLVPWINRANTAGNAISEQEEPLNLTMNSEDKPNNPLNDDDDDAKQLQPCVDDHSIESMIANQLSSYESAKNLYSQILQTVFYARPILPRNPNSPSPVEVANEIAKAFEEVKKLKEKPAPGKMKKMRSSKCNQCSLDFPAMTNLTEHTLSIYGSYKCHICQVGFIRRYNMLKHTMKHLHIMPYMCKVCCKEFDRKDVLCSHIASDHFKTNPKRYVIKRMPPLETFNYIDKQQSEMASCSRGSLKQFDFDEDDNVEVVEGESDETFTDNIFLKGELL